VWTRSQEIKVLNINSEISGPSPPAPPPPNLLLPFSCRVKRRGLDVLIIDSDSCDAFNAASAAASAADSSSVGAYDMIIGSAVLESICNGSANAAPSFLQWDLLAALHLQYPPWLRCTLQGCCVTLSGGSYWRATLLLFR
jgi:hypothetical protein